MDTKELQHDAYHTRVQHYGEQHPAFHTREHMQWLREHNKKAKAMKRHTIEVYDNGGETFDRYTVIIDGVVYGMSANALQPNGFNQFCGLIADLPGAREGERITIESLPEEVQGAIQRRAA